MTEYSDLVFAKKDWNGEIYHVHDGTFSEPEHWRRYAGSIYHYFQLGGSGFGRRTVCFYPVPESTCTDFENRHGVETRSRHRASAAVTEAYLNMVDPFEWKWNEKFQFAHTRLYKFSGAQLAVKNDVCKRCGRFIRFYELNHKSN